MRRLTVLLAAVASLFPLLSPSLHAAPSDFAGIWTGEITAPDTRADLGLAFTPTPDGLLVSLHFPEMFLHTVNFGAADIRDDTFTLAPLQLVLTRNGDELLGTFAPTRLSVRLRRGGTFAEPPPPPDLPPAPAPRWQRSLGAPVWSSPAVHENTVYVAATDGRVHALQAADGEPLWTWTGPHPFFGDILVTADALYLLDEQSHFFALSRADGALLWQLDLHENTDTPDADAPPRNETFNHRSAAPVLDARGILYVGSTDRHLYAINARSGRVVWRHATSAPLYAPVALHGEYLLAACYDGTLFSLHRRNRRERFRITLPGPLVSAPVVAGDRVIIGCRDTFLYGLDANTGATRWRKTYWFSWVESTARLADNTLYIGGSDFRRVSALAPRDGRPLWSTDVLGLSWGSPVVTSDTVFAGTAGRNIDGTVITHRGGIVALDRQTGAIRWRHATATPSDAPFNGIAGSLALAGDLVIAADVHGTLLAFPAAPDSK
jgi:FOG: WD40-like repeat